MNCSGISRPTRRQQWLLVKAEALGFVKIRRGATGEILGMPAPPFASVADSWPEIHVSLTAPGLTFIMRVSWANAQGMPSLLVATNCTVISRLSSIRVQRACKPRRGLAIDTQGIAQHVVKRHHHDEDESKHATATATSLVRCRCGSVNAAAHTSQCRSVVCPQLGTAAAFQRCGRAQAWQCPLQPFCAVPDFFID